ncbi:hypothetical protein HK100_001570 [Physocladia obscura]|uniref:Uncharacterized protein n=1 Tax=Physocladia obscura TaxID=109957 RepID=A0AAD5SWZ0_9FUNG|nr:hypothetical protein HK100_001570 [Physocladia obscura]
MLATAATSASDLSSLSASASLPVSVSSETLQSQSRYPNSNAKIAAPLKYKVVIVAVASAAVATNAAVRVSLVYHEALSYRELRAIESNSHSLVSASNSDPNSVSNVVCEFSNFSFYISSRKCLPPSIANSYLMASAFHSRQHILFQNDRLEEHFENDEESKEIPFEQKLLNGNIEVEEIQSNDFVENQSDNFNVALDKES